MESAVTATDVIIVTGSSGLIGYPLAARLSQEFAVVGFDREGPPHPPPSAHCMTVDITSEEQTAAAFDEVRRTYGERIASVIHLAAFYDFSGEPSPKYDEITVGGTERLLRHLQQFEVEQFLFSSTMLVHAPSSAGERISETSPLAPSWPYPKSKVRTEALIRRKRENIPVLSLRIAGVYDGMTHSIPLAHQMERIEERDPLSHFFPGDPSHGQSFVHLEDVIEAIVLAVDRRKTLPPELALLIGEPDPVSYEELQRLLGLHLHGKPWRVMRLPKTVAKAGAWLQQQLPVVKETFIKPWMIDRADDHYPLDISLAQKTLGWTPRHSLRETIPEMITSLRDDPGKWYRENNLTPPGSLREDRDDSGAEMNMKTHHDLMENSEGHHDMMREHHEKYLWCHFAIAILGLWLVSSPVAFGQPLDIYAGSQMLAGLLLVVFGFLSVNGRRLWAPWGSCFVGIALLMSPLVFWAPSAASYANDTLVGALVIALSVLIPGMPGMMKMPGAEIPPGWTYNPSSWQQRFPMIALAFFGFFLARYLTAYQLGHTGWAWDPFFGNGTVRVLDSDVSKAWPISDAGLGAATYMLEALSGFMGGRDRWRTMPWMVLMFFLLVVPLGVTSIVLVMMQPVMVGAWCTLCLVTAVAMLIMIPLALDEVIAMGQFMMQARREKKPLWSIFWMGGSIEGERDDRTVPFTASLRDQWRAMTWGVTLPWNIMAAALLGVWLLAAPAVLGSTGAMANSNYITGAMVTTFSVLALAEAGRAARFLNFAFGAWIVIAPFVLDPSGAADRWNGAVAGALLIALSIRRGPVREQYGSWQRWI